MIKKKVCLIGAYAVGKTSLVSRFVSGIFSEDYLTTVGVKIDRRELEVDGRGVLLMVWDLAGRDEFQSVRKSYLQGAAGFVYVVDGTRPETLDGAREEMAEIAGRFPDVPGVLLLNKRDLKEEWELDGEAVSDFREAGLAVMETSAKTGENVAEAFAHLARAMCA